MIFQLKKGEEHLIVPHLLCIEMYLYNVEINIHK